MQKTKNKATTKDYTLTLTKEIGNLWIVEDIFPFRKKFELFFDKELDHDIAKVTACGATNYVLDIIAGDRNRMDVELRMATERMELPDYVEFELVAPYSLAAKYYVNNCPERPRLIAWVNASVREIFKEYPVFAYIKVK